MHGFVMEEYGSSYSYFVEYLVNRSTNPSYSSCGFPNYMNPTTTSFGSGRIYFHMNWGWYGTGNGWFSGNNVNPTDDRNYQYDSYCLQYALPVVNINWTLTRLISIDTI